MDKPLKSEFKIFYVILISILYMHKQYLDIFIMLLFVMEVQMMSTGTVFFIENLFCTFKQ